MTSRYIAGSSSLDGYDLDSRNHLARSRRRRSCASTPGRGDLSSFPSEAPGYQPKIRAVRRIRDLGISAFVHESVSRSEKQGGTGKRVGAARTERDLARDKREGRLRWPRAQMRNVNARRRRALRKSAHGVASGVRVTSNSVALTAYSRRVRARGRLPARRNARERRTRVVRRRLRRARNRSEERMERNKSPSCRGSDGDDDARRHNTRRIPGSAAD